MQWTSAIPQDRIQQREIDIFGSSTGNLNINTLDHLKKNSAFVGDTEQFRQEDRLGWLRGLGKYECRQSQASEDSFRLRRWKSFCLPRRSQ